MNSKSAPVFGLKIKMSKAVGVPAVNRRRQVGQNQRFAQPVDLSGDARSFEFQPFEGRAFRFKPQIRVLRSAQRRVTVHLRRARAPRSDTGPSPRRFSADGARHRARIRRTETVGEINPPRVEIHGDAVGPHLLHAGLQPRLEKFEEPVCITESHFQRCPPISPRMVKFVSARCPLAPMLSSSYKRPHTSASSNKGWVKVKSSENLPAWLRPAKAGGHPGPAHRVPASDNLWWHHSRHR